MKAFVTGGSGFIGRHLIPKLVARGYDVYALARSDDSIATVEAMGATAVPGDITDIASIREGMRGSDVVFHLAGWYELGAKDWWRGETINVGGTRKVLRLAQELGIPKVVYASTVAVFGDTGGKAVDEEYYAGGPFLTEYDRTKWLAHYKVALPMMEKGVPVIIVMPGVVYGPGDHSLVGSFMKAFYQGLFPVLPGPETTFTYAHVDDIAEGIALAAEKGKIGESYVLAGPPIPLGEMVDFWAQLSGRPKPILHIPARFVRPLAPVMGFLNNLFNLPSLFSQDSIAILGATYSARADKARSELGWRTRTLQSGMLETLQHVAAEVEAEKATPRARELKFAGLALVAAAVVFLSWLLLGRRSGEG